MSSGETGCVSGRNGTQPVHQGTRAPPELPQKTARIIHAEAPEWPTRPERTKFWSKSNWLFQGLPDQANIRGCPYKEVWGRSSEFKGRMAPASPVESEEWVMQRVKKLWLWQSSKSLCCGTWCGLGCGKFNPTKLLISMCANCLIISAKTAIFHCAL